MSATHENDDDDSALGATVRATLDAGRQRGIEWQHDRRAPLERVVRRELDLDQLDGHPAIGRAARIAERSKIPRRTVSRILRKLLGQTRETDLHNVL
jgi:DNA invertase Pin-like site-specific DNA recombinase